MPANKPDKSLAELLLSEEAPKLWSSRDDLLIDLAAEIQKFYRVGDALKLQELYASVLDFELKAAKLKSADREFIFRTKRQMDLASHLADCEYQGENIFVAEKKSKELLRHQLPVGEIRKFCHQVLGCGPAIQLETFVTVIDNEVYGKNTGVVTENGQEVPVRSIVLLERITEPSKKQVLEYLVQKAKALEKVSAGSPEFENCSFLEKEIMKLHKETQKSLRNGSHPRLSELASGNSALTGNNRLIPGNFVCIRYVFVPTKEYFSRRAAGKFGWVQGYEALFQDEALKKRGFGGLWEIIIPYDGNYLENKQKMDEKLRRSKIIRSDDAKRVIDSLYTVDWDQGYYLKLRDNSARIIEKTALKIVHSIQQDQDQREAEQVARQYRLAAYSGKKPQGLN